MTTAPHTVPVYNFLDMAQGFELAEVSTFKATRQAIAERYQGDCILATEEWVALDDLDAQGRYRRVPTGWGALAMA